MPVSPIASVACFVTAVTLAACSSISARNGGGPAVPGNPQRGAAAISRYGCGSCHRIAGVSGAHGLVGPPLTGIGSRLYIAGTLPNNPDNMAKWVQHPALVNQNTVMPELGVRRDEAVDIAAYLYSLK